jgi:hypothetical protein
VRSIPAHRRLRSRLPLWDTSLLVRFTISQLGIWFTQGNPAVFPISQGFPFFHNLAHSTLHSHTSPHLSTRLGTHENPGPSCSCCLILPCPSHEIPTVFPQPLSFSQYFLYLSEPSFIPTPFLISQPFPFKHFFFPFSASCNFNQPFPHSSKLLSLHPTSFPATREVNKLSFLQPPFLFPTNFFSTNFPSFSQPSFIQLFSILCDLRLTQTSDSTIHGALHPLRFLTTR